MEPMMSHAALNALEATGKTCPALAEPSTLRRIYQVHTAPARIKSARQGLWVAVFVYMLFAASDFILIPDVATETVLARLLVGLLSVLVLEISCFAKAGARTVEAIAASAIAAGYLFWLVPALQTQATESIRLYMIFGTIFMMGANLFFIFPFVLSVLTSIVVLAILLISMTVMFPHDPIYLLTFGLFYISCFIFTSYVNWKLNGERYNVFLNALEAAHQHREAEKRGVALERLSNTDYLTGVDNRRAVDKRLRDYWSDWQNNGKAFAAILKLIAPRVVDRMALKALKPEFRPKPIKPAQ